MASAGCDLSGLSESEKKRRTQKVETLQYVDESPEEDKNCGNCQLYEKDKYGDGCGDCNLLPGPVAETGYCTSWVGSY